MYHIILNVELFHLIPKELEVQWALREGDNFGAWTTALGVWEHLAGVGGGGEIFYLNLIFP